MPEKNSPARHPLPVSASVSLPVSHTRCSQGRGLREVAVNCLAKSQCSAKAMFSAQACPLSPSPAWGTKSETQPLCHLSHFAKSSPPSLVTGRATVPRKWVKTKLALPPAQAEGAGRGLGQGRAAFFAAFEVGNPRTLCRR